MAAAQLEESCAQLEESCAVPVIAPSPARDGEESCALAVIAPSPTQDGGRGSYILEESCAQLEESCAVPVIAPSPARDGEESCALAVIAPSPTRDGGRGSYIVQCAKLELVVKTSNLTFDHCAKIMEFCPDGEQGDRARQVVLKIRVNLFQVQAAMGVLFSNAEMFFRTLLLCARKCVTVCQNPGLVSEPAMMLALLQGESENMEEVQQSILKSLTVLMKVSEYGEQLAEASNSEAVREDLHKFVMEAVTSKEGTGAAHGRSLLERSEEAHKQHGESRARCAKLGDELTNLKAEESQLAATAVVLETIAEKRQESLQNLEAKVSQITERSDAASEHAANAVDRRWAVKQKCNRDKHYSDDNESCAQRRAAKYRALKQEFEADLDAAEEKTKKAQNELAKVNGRLTRIKQRLAGDDASGHGGLVEELKAEVGICTECKQKIDEIKQEISDYEEKYSGSSLGVIADFKNCLQSLPKQFSAQALSGNDLFAYIRQTLQNLSYMLKMFRTLISAFNDRAKTLSQDEMAVQKLTGKMKFMLLPAVDAIIANSRTDMAKMSSLASLHNAGQTAMKAATLQNDFNAPQNAKSLPLPPTSGTDLASLTVEASLDEPAVKKLRQDADEYLINPIPVDEPI